MTHEQPNCHANPTIYSCTTDVEKGGNSLNIVPDLRARGKRQIINQHSLGSLLPSKINEKIL